MPLRLPTVLLIALLATSACSEVRETASRTSDCVGLGRDVASSGLTRTPTRAEAERAVQRLEDRVDSLEDPEVRAAATELRDRLRALERAADANDPAQVQQAADAAREAGRDAARACSLPVDQFLG